ncbi:MAG: hypothetical protein J6331_04400 [Lentisphaeria bacterium]|nr:hypothetical protein [Lentisphaeria bacterium]
MDKTAIKDDDFRKVPGNPDRERTFFAGGSLQFKSSGGILRQVKKSFSTKKTKEEDHEKVFRSPCAGRFPRNGGG